MEDWETMWPETAASPSQEQSLLQWIMGDVEDPSSGLKQFLQGVGPSDFESNNGGFGIVTDSSASGLEAQLGTLNNNNNTVGIPATTGFLLNNGRLVVPNSVPNHPPFHSKAPVLPSATTNNNSNPIFSPSSNNTLPISLSSPVFYQQQQPPPQQFELAEEKPQLLNPQLLINHHPSQNPAFFAPLTSYPRQDPHFLPPQPKRHHPTAIDPGFQISNSGQDSFYHRRSHHHHQQQGFPQQQLHRPLIPTSKDKAVGPIGDEVALAQHQHQLLLDQLLKAAELVESGNSVHARGILARLNHHLSPVGKPHHRAAFYFKEALLLITNNNNNNNPPQRINTPFDVFLKINSYKAFSESSPILQFANFTSNQALLEALDGFNTIRIIDFDLGLGSQWSSYMQEISLKTTAAPSLKITAITSPSSHDHPLELHLAKDNLSQFATDLGLSFAIEILNLDSFDPASWSLALNVLEGEAVAVNLPASRCDPLVLRLLKQLSPKVVVSVERGGCDRGDLPFLQYFLSSLNSYSILMESLDAVSANADADTVNKIERFLIQPRIDGAVLRRHCVAEKVPPCRTQFASAGFSPFEFSNFTETQAEWLVKRIRVRGFHVEKRQNSLVLCWHMQDLVSVAAWTC